MEDSKIGLIKSSLSYHMNQVNCIKLNPLNGSQLLSCGQDGCYAIWNLQNYERRYGSYICNFLKDGFFLDEFTIGVVGSGSFLYKVLKSNGNITAKLNLQVSYSNIIIPFISLVSFPFYVYGG